MRDESVLSGYPERLEQLKGRMIQVAQRERVRTASMSDEERAQQRAEDDRLLAECEALAKCDEIARSPELWQRVEAERARQDGANIILGAFVVVTVVGIALSVGYWICLGLAGLAKGRCF